MKKIQAYGPLCLLPILALLSSCFGSPFLEKLGQGKQLGRFTIAYRATQANFGTTPFDGRNYAAGDKVTVLSHGDLERRDSTSAYKFDGWSLTNSEAKRAVSYRENDQLMITSDLALYDVWKEVAGLRVTFDANGGSGAVPIIAWLFAEQQNFQLPAVGGLQKSGFTFAGWSLNSAGTGRIYSAGDTFTMPASNVTLYAIWQGQARHSVTYHTGNGLTSGSLPIDLNSYLPGTTITVQGIGPAMRTGYSFGGWTTSDITGTGTLYQGGQSFTMPNKSVVFMAVWTAIK